MTNMIYKYQEQISYVNGNMVVATDKLSTHYSVVVMQRRNTISVDCDGLRDALDKEKALCEQFGEQADVEIVDEKKFFATTIFFESARVNFETIVTNRMTGNSTVVNSVWTGLECLESTDRQVMSDAEQLQMIINNDEVEVSVWMHTHAYYTVEKESFVERAIQRGYLHQMVYDVEMDGE